MKNIALAIAVAFIFTASSDAQCVNCPDCGQKVAVGFLKKTENKKTVYEVSNEEIAVPNICMPRPLINMKAQVCNLFGRKCCPGEPCGGNKIEECPKHVRGGQVRVVRVLKKSSVKCDACAYEWEVTEAHKVDEYLYDIKSVEEGSESPTPAAAEKAAPAQEATMPREATPPSGIPSIQMNPPTLESPPTLRVQPTLEPQVIPLETPEVKSGARHYRYPSTNQYGSADNSSPYYIRQPSAKSNRR